MKYLPILCLLFCISCTSDPENVVLTDKGYVQGAFNDDQTILSFKGIPFAAPPLGKLRWKAPQPAAAWEGIREATEFAASPMQNPPQPFYCWTEEFIAQPEPLSEDCLYLNIWTPTEDETPKPVLVWIYGGGFVSGSSNCDIYDGEEMAKQGVVFVSLNYRVGVLGFLAHPELSRESGQQASGNYGFLDQIAALQWIQNNIQAFGGDPDRVTIAGQSAGAFSVNTLVASPLTGGLFHRAIQQSGGLLSDRLIQSLTEAEAVGQRLLEKAEVASIDALRQLPAEQLQTLSNDPEIGPFGVTLDGYVLPTDLVAHFAAGRHQQVPIIAGWVTGDGDFFSNPDLSVADYQARAAVQYGEQADAFLQLFPATTDAEAQAADRKLSMLHFAALPAHRLAGYHSQPTYLYQFGHVPPDKPDFPNYGAFHTSEVPYTLHTLHRWQRPWQAEDRQIEAALSAYWVNFAKSGDPNGAGLPAWPPYEPPTGTVLTIDQGQIDTVQGLLSEEFAFLERSAN